MTPIHRFRSSCEPRARVRQRFEVTVERETVSLFVRRQPVGNTPAAAAAVTVTQAEAIELPPAEPSPLSLAPPASKDPIKNPE
jgi:hypothetical protein